MGLYEQIKDIANQKKVSIARLERDLDLSNGSVSKWSINTPSIDKIEKVANYFNISIDYLLDRESPSNKNIEDDLTAFFRINTEGMSEDEVDTLKEELEDFMLIRAERLKRKKAKKDD